MNPESEIERLIASVAGGQAVDWDEAVRRATSEEERTRIAALRAVDRIAAFGHAQRGELAASPETHAGQAIGAYTLESLIGEGGMGAVWQARRSDGRFEGRVAVKLLHLPLVGRHGPGRFQREGHILARLRHANIERLLDAGVTDAGQPYLVLEHVDGVAIDRYCEAHGLDVRARIGLFLEVLQAVAHAQSNLVLHRDLKPSNILVDQTGQVKLLDFGVAKLLEEESSPQPATALTERVGRAFTPEFAAPEQLLDEPVTTATDVYAAGIVLYMLLTGRHPTVAAGGGSPVERMKAILEAEPKLASAAVMDPPLPGNGRPELSPHARERLRRQLRGDLDNILAKAMKKSPDERYANAAAFADDLRRHLAEQPVLARADSMAYRIDKFVRRHRGAVAGTSLAAIALVAATLFAFSQLVEARRQRDEARQQTQRAQAFNGVVTSLLSQTGPGGRALSPEELLDQAVQEMEARYADDPAFLVDMLIRISGRYFDLRDTNKEYATLVKADRIARRTGDPALVFDVQVNTVETELAAGRKDEAKRRIEEARRLLPSLKKVPSMEDYFRAESEFARANDDLPAAVGYLERARRLLEKEDRTHGNSYPGILSNLAVCRGLLGQLKEAHECQAAIVELDKRLGRETTVPGITSRTSLAGSFYSLGEVQRARTLMVEAVPELEQPGAPLTPGIGYRYGDIASRLGEHEHAIRLIREDLAALHESGNELQEVRANVFLARALLRAGRPAEASAPLDQALALIDADAPAYVSWLAESSRLRAEIRLREHRLEDARREVDAALARLDYPGKRTAAGIPTALLTLSRVQIAQRQPAAALESARASLEFYEQQALDPRQSANVGEALLALAAAQRATGDAAGTRANLGRAAGCLRNGLGAGHELTRQAERLLGETR